MLGYLVLLLLVSEGLCAIAIPVPDSDPDPVIEAPAGRFRGKILTTGSGRSYESYRGIPYAQPPIGNLRFAKPQPLPKINGTFDAKTFGSICIQPKKNVDDRGDEDCLTLNVFTPQRNNSNRLRNVLVYVHGGAGISGSSKEYLPGNLVTREGIVVVTMNYRLGYLGILRGDGDQLPGNQALWDVLLALSWIQDNIASFGGNPCDVTYSGQGMGSFFGMYLSISPLAKGLFNKAIFSGSGFIDYPFPPTTSTDLLEKAVSEFGCDQPCAPFDVGAAISCLKQLPALDFDVQFTFPFFTLLTSSNDEILPRRPQELRTNSTYLASVGFASRDYFIWLAKDDGLYSFDSILQSIDVSTPIKAEQNLKEALQFPIEMVKAILRPYQALTPCNASSVPVGSFSNYFRVQTANFFEALAIVDVPCPGQTYYMSFDHEPSYTPNSIFPRTLELAYLFDISPKRLFEISYPKLSVDGGFQKEDRQLKSLFISLVSDFVKSGDPGINILRKFDADWPPYEDEFKYYLSFSNSPRVGQDLLRERGGVRTSSHG